MFSSSGEVSSIANKAAFSSLPASFLKFGTSQVLFSIYMYVTLYFFMFRSSEQRFIVSLAQLRTL